MKKIISCLISLSFLLAAITGSAAFAQGESSESGTKKISVVTTIFPPYDFIREIAGDLVDVTMLLPIGTESHSFEPTPRDIIAIQNCDIFIYVGGEGDKWVERILSSMDTSNFKTIALVDCVNAVTEEIVEGMEADHDHDHGDEEFDPANVQDRLFSDFDGSWISGVPLINDGSLDDYLAEAAEDADITLAEQKEKTLGKWASDYDNIQIGNDQLTINGASAAYAYQGYRIVESDHGASVWYQYQSTDPASGLPEYLAFNDHKYTSEEAHDDHEEIAHMHMRYGNESFEALMAEGVSSPFYFDSSYTNAEIGAFMGGGHSHDEDEALDEHVWTSPVNAKRIVAALAKALAEKDAGNAAAYQANAQAYAEKLDELDAAFKQVTENAVRTTLVFGDRFPFRYLTDAYGLTYYAAFAGCATETEASAATIAFLIKKVREEQVPAVFTIELSNGKIADAIVESTGTKKLALQSAHNLTRAEFEAGIGYLDLMWQNVEALKEALQ